MATFSASVNGIFMLSVRRSPGAFDGRPVLMVTNHTHKNFSVNRIIG
jgi:hypothetical protein